MLGAIRWDHPPVLRRLATPPQAAEPMRTRLFLLAGLLLLGLVLISTSHLSIVLLLIVAACFVAVFAGAPHRFVVVSPAMIAALPYLTAKLPHIFLVTPSRVYLVAGLLILRKLPKSPNQQAESLYGIARRYSVLYLLAVILVTVPRGISSNQLGLALDIALLPYVYLLVLLPRATALSERTRSSTALTCLAVLLFEMAIGGYEFTTGHRFLGLQQQSVVAYNGLNPDEGVRALGTFLTTETYCLTCALLGLFLTAYFARRKHGLLALVAAIAGGAAVTFSGTRDTLVVYLPLVVFVFLRARHNALVRTVWVALCTFPLLVLVNLLFHPLTNATISGRASNPDNIDSRFAAFRAAWNMFLDHPFFGVGIGNYFNAAQQARYEFTFHGIPAPPAPHNTYLSVLAETGLVGALPFVLLWICILRVLWLSRGSRGVSVAIVLLLLLDSLADNQGQEVPSLIATAFLIGISSFAMRSGTILDDGGRVRYGSTHAYPPIATKLVGISSARLTRPSEVRKTIA